MREVVTLSDGAECNIRVLGLFELQNEVAPEEEPGPFAYSFEVMGGEVVRKTYDAEDFANPPPKPSIPREEATKENSQPWFAWQEWDTYQAALAHQQQQLILAEKYAKDVAAYIMTHCLEEEDRSRIVTEEDWQKVYRAAMIPTVTEEDIEAALSRIFQGYVQGQADPTGAERAGPIRETEGPR
jgi:hypothetical protein